MDILFYTDDIYLLDLINELKAIGYERWDDYNVVGKFGSCHKLTFKPHVVFNQSAKEFCTGLALSLPGNWLYKISIA